MDKLITEVTREFMRFHITFDTEFLLNEEDEIKLFFDIVKQLMNIYHSNEPSNNKHKLLVSFADKYKDIVPKLSEIEFNPLNSKFIADTNLEKIYKNLLLILSSNCFLIRSYYVNNK